MPYVPGFTNDIFISFSYVDNWDGWVANFQDLLLNRLRLLLGTQVTSWRDNKQHGPDAFSDEIFTQLQQSALLISIVSPPAIKSRWCEDEWQAFERFADRNGGFRVANEPRAIKVVKSPLPADQHRELFGMRGFEFYERDTQSNCIHEFDQSGPEFERILLDLAQNIQRLLDDLSLHLKAASQEHTVKAAAQRDTVYVATTTPDLKRSRDAIVQQFDDWGYAVAPLDPDPPNRFASFLAVTNAELAASIFSVHLVNDQAQPILEGGQDAISRQYQLAQSMRKDRIVWIEPGRQLYAEFDDAIKNGLQKGVEILQDCSIEDLKDVIEERLNRGRHQPEPSRKNFCKENSSTEEQPIEIKQTVEVETADPLRTSGKRFAIEEYRTLYEAALNATTTAKGGALEDLAEYMFLCVPGLDIRARNLRTLTEEIDLAFSNQGDGFWRDIGSPFIVECRNLIQPVSAKMIRDFVGKMHTKAMRTGFIVTTSYVTKDGVIEQRQALRDGTTVVSVEGKDLSRIATEGNLLRVFEDRYFHCRLL